MVRYLSNYKGSYRVFVVSKGRETTVARLSEGLSVGELTAERLTFFPENVVVPLSANEKKLFEVFDEGDVLDINEKGILYRWYSASEGDAGMATTSLCNSNCRMCPASDNERRQKSSLTIEQMDAVLRHMPKDLWHFTITGGEPTLIGEDDFLHLLASIKRELPLAKILLLTNGRTLGDKEFFGRFIREAPQNIRVAIPIHGSTPEKHDYITQAPGSFAQTLRAVAALLRSKAEVELRIVVSKLNSDDITDMARLIIDRFSTVTVVNFVGLEMRGNCVAHSEQVLISYQDAFAQSRDAMRLLIKSGIDVGLYNFPYCMIDKRYWPIAKQSISAHKSVFCEECDSCSLKDECCGIFSATMKYYKPSVYPIANEGAP